MDENFPAVYYWTKDRKLLFWKMYNAPDATSNFNVQLIKVCKNHINRSTDLIYLFEFSEIWYINTDFEFDFKFWRRMLSYSHSTPRGGAASMCSEKVVKIWSLQRREISPKTFFKKQHNHSNFKICKIKIVDLTNKTVERGTFKSFEK